MVILKVRVKEDDYIDKYFCIPILVLFLVFAAIILIIQVTVTRSMTSRWNQWEEFSSCSVTCGPGVKVRRRICPGAVCWDTSVEVVRCVEALCHSSHETRWMKRADDWNEWTDWSECNATCEEPGVRWRNIICQESDETVESSSCEESRIEIEECFKECPIDEWAVSWLEWSNFGKCNATCGPGNQTRHRVCASWGCTGDDTESIPCFLHDCAIDGKWGQWSNFTACTSPCGVGSQMRTRRCDDPSPLYDGSVCNGSDTDVKPCNVHDCYSWTSWSNLTQCSTSCGSGTQTRLRHCEPLKNIRINFIANCIGLSLETIPCFSKECPIDGNWGQWSNFTACSSPCGVGSRMRTRRCDDPSPFYDGSVCNGSDTDMKPCNVHDCYSWTSWSNLTQCSTSCGSGSQTRLRHCEPLKNIRINFIANCIGLSLETIPCFSKECPIDGNWGQWSNFTACSSPCGVGSRMRYRRCDDPTPLYNGSVCNGSDVDTKSCNVRDCYSWTSWAGTSACSVSCGNGTMTRLRKCESIVNTTIHFTGNCSGHSLETIPCFMKKCIDVVDCSFENGGCSHLCLKYSSDGYCSCYPGYALDSDGKTCSDVDECIGANNCDGFCINASGTYFCLCYKPNHYWNRKIMKCIPKKKKNKTVVKIK